MVVNWSGNLPNRPGRWLMLRLGIDKGKGIYGACIPTPTLIDVYNHRFYNCLYANSDINTDSDTPIEQMYEWEFKMGYVKFSTTPIQFNNIDWEYKFTKSMD